MSVLTSSTYPAHSSNMKRFYFIYFEFTQIQEKSSINTNKVKQTTNPTPYKHSHVVEQQQADTGLIRDDGRQRKVAVFQPALVQPVLQNVHLLQLSFQVLFQLHTHNQTEMLT